MARRIIVIGAGAAGLMAAYAAASAGAEVILLEKMPTPGRKLLVTGKGQCNITSHEPLASFITHYFGQGRFLYPAFNRFFNNDLLDLLASQGLSFRTEPSGKVFPDSNRAADVVQALTGLCRRAGVRLQCGQTVTGILTCSEDTLPTLDQGDFSGTRAGRPASRIRGVTVKNGTVEADAVILTCGGMSWPGTGSTGDGYRMAVQLGHKLVIPRPALVPLTCTEPWPGSLSGISCPDIRASLLCDGQPAGQAQGDLLFTHTGLSGPVILRLSRDYYPDRSGTWQIEMDLKPDISHEFILSRLSGLALSHPRWQLSRLVGETGWLPRAVLSALIASCGLPSDRQACHVSKKELDRVAGSLHRLRLTISGTRGWQEAMVTAGGISLSEIDPRTMMSRLVTDMYLAGEVLDIDGDTGGYNLQAAFSTGHLAGSCAAGTGSSDLKSL